MIFVFTGNGQGKTTAAIGKGIRAKGAGRKVLMVQFLKTKESSEYKILKNIFKIKTFGKKGFFLPQSKLARNPELKKKGVRSFSKEARKIIKKGWDFVKRNLQAGKYDFFILDEINVVLYYKLINKREFLDFLNRFKKKLDIVLTGRYAPKEIIETADLVTKFNEVKHPFQKGEKAKRGLDF